MTTIGTVQTLTALISTLTKQIGELTRCVADLKEKNEKLTQKSTEIVKSQWKAYHKITDLEKIICGTPEDPQAGLTMMVLKNAADIVEEINKKVTCGSEIDNVEELEKQAHKIVKDMDPEMYKKWTSKEVRFEDFAFTEKIIQKKLDDLKAAEGKNAKISIWEDLIRFISKPECKQYITHHPPFQKALQNKMVEIYNDEKHAPTYRCYRSIFGERIPIS